MRLLLDSANLDEIAKWTASGVVAGVTTNPSLVAKEDGIGSYREYVQKLLSVITDQMQHVSVEVVSLDPDVMIDQGMVLGKMASDRGLYRMHVKVPVLPRTMRVIKTLSDEGIRVNATACFTGMQAKLAADAGADIVSFFYRRMIDYYYNTVDAEREITDFASYSDGAEVICGSVRTMADVTGLWKIKGVDYVTCNGAIIDQLLTNQGTHDSVLGFQKDIDTWLASRSGL